ncbi:hypothetical protein Tco_0110205 [Tanacetum coccineum]
MHENFGRQRQEIWCGEVDWCRSRLISLKCLCILSLRDKSSVGTVKVRHQQIEADPSLVPLSPHQKLTGISMAQN